MRRGLRTVSMGRAYYLLARWRGRSMSARAGTVAGLGKTRVEALTDGIFGAVMTVLGLSLTIPYITGPANQQLPALEDIVTGVLTYSLSFVTVGDFWVAHHAGCQIRKRTDRAFSSLTN